MSSCAFSCGAASFILRRCARKRRPARCAKSTLGCLRCPTFGILGASHKRWPAASSWKRSLSSDSPGVILSLLLCSSRELFWHEVEMVHDCGIRYREYKLLNTHAVSTISDTTPSCPPPPTPPKVITPGRHRERHSWVYLQGAGDDEEHWSAGTTHVESLLPSILVLYRRYPLFFSVCFAMPESIVLSTAGACAGGVMIRVDV